MSTRRDARPITWDSGDAVYGLITIGAVLAVESTRRETYAETLAAVAIAAVLYWLAHAYSDLLGDRLAGGDRLTVRGLLRCLGSEALLLAGAAVPVAAVLVCWASGASLATATWAAVAVCAALIIAIELWAGVRAGAEGVELVLEALTGALLGLLLIALKILLH